MRQDIQELIDPLIEELINKNYTTDEIVSALELTIMSLKEGEKA